MTREEAEGAARSDEYADKDRAWLAAWITSSRQPGAAVDVQATADWLAWDIRRTELALVAAEEAGLVRAPNAPSRGLTTHTVAYSR